MNRSESKYYNTACLMDDAPFFCLKKRISNISRSKKFAIKPE